MSCYIVRSWHVMTDHIMTCHVMPYRSMSYHIIPYPNITCHIMTCHIRPCHSMPQHVTSCHALSYDVISCHVMLYQAMCDMSCNGQAMSCHLNGLNIMSYTTLHKYVRIYMHDMRPFSYPFIYIQKCEQFACLSDTFMHLFIHACMHA